MADSTWYVAEETATLREAVPLPKQNGKKPARAAPKNVALLWGDRVIRKKDGKVWARGYEGTIDDDVIDQQSSLLEVYFIDVGQGDGILIRTPDDRHLVIDGGNYKKNQITQRNAADFIDWKFGTEYRRDQIVIDAMIASHCDGDLYGGLHDLVRADEAFRKAEYDTPKRPKVKSFYHAGVSHWIPKKGGTKGLGEISDGFLFSLLEDDLESVTQQDVFPQLAGEWGEFLAELRTLKPKVQRLSQLSEYLPGFGKNNDLRIRVLAPFQHEVGGRSCLRAFDSGSGKTTNGNSVLLRLDYDRARILLTGDLNKGSQAKLVKDWPDVRRELAADVAKGCHHGSDDVSYNFLSMINAGCTVISSGDTETHGHPRPSIVAAAGQTGYTQIDNDELTTPLVYSTEISRSYRLSNQNQYLLDDEDDKPTKLKPSDLSIKVKTSSKSAKEIPAESAHVVSGIVYGLVNVRTDGKKILCAIKNEGKEKWEIRTFTSRF